MTSSMLIRLNEINDQLKKASDIESKQKLLRQLTNIYRNYYGSPCDACSQFHHLKHTLSARLISVSL